MKYVRCTIKRRIKELRETLSHNGNAEFQDEFELLHTMIKEPLPKDYEPNYYD